VTDQSNVLIVDASAPHGSDLFMLHTSTGASRWLAGLSFTFALVGCSAGSGDTGSGGAGQGGSTSAFGDGGSSSTFGDGGSMGIGGGCVGSENVAQKVPLDMYIMLDQSGSMGDPPSNGSGSKWDAVTQALTAFVNQGGSDISVGIQYFPIPSGVSCPITPVQCTSDADCQTGCGPCEMPIPGFGICSGVGDSDSCEAMDYAMADVEIAALPGNAGPINSSMAAHGPTGGTPTLPALQGAIDHASGWANAHPGHVAIVVLATDGDPASCDTDLGHIDAVAASGVALTPSILTFVIGVGGSVSALNGIANAGGTGSAFMIDTSPDVQTAFLDALNQIQGQSLPCSYLIPDPPPGQTLNFDEVNVTHTPANSTTPTTIPQVADASQCPPSGDAWYYDNPGAPTQIMLCPSTCTAYSAEQGATVKVVLGCATVVQ
jgi:hypothetical protein